MRDLEYPVHPVRMSDEVWAQLKQNKEASGLSWNLFFKELLEEEYERP